MDLAEEALQGSQLAGARLIRLLEERDPVGIEGLKVLYPHSGSAYLVGVTGPPGVGKSTLLDRIDPYSAAEALIERLQCEI